MLTALSDARLIVSVLILLVLAAFVWDLTAELVRRLRLVGARRRFGRDQHARLVERLLRDELCLSSEEPLPRRVRTYPLEAVLAEALDRERGGDEESRPGDEEKDDGDSVEPAGE